VSGRVRIPSADRPALRLAWLREHGTDLPGAYGDITTAQRQGLEFEARAMRTAGLYTPAAYLPGLRWALRVMLSAIRNERPPTWAERRSQRYRS